MNKSDKKIAIVYVFLGVLIISYLYYIKESITYPENLDLYPGPKEKITLVNVITTSRDLEKLFGSFTDVENYPRALPYNVLSVNIVNRSNNVVFAEEELIEKGIRTKLLAKHTFFPYEKHVIEVMDGDAKGTKITQTFAHNALGIQITTDIELHLKGPLQIIAFLPGDPINKLMDKVITSFISYNRGYLSLWSFSGCTYEGEPMEQFDIEDKLMIDDLYREILFRPVRTAEACHYLPLFLDGKMTIEDIRQELLDLDEYKQLLNSTRYKASLQSVEMKTIEELGGESKIIVNNLYKEILFRSADSEGLEHYASLLESGKITIEDIRKELLNSEERKSLE